MRTAIPFALLAAALAGSLFTAPAYAARDRVFVASFGTDTGNTTCSFTQPCRTFQNAVNNVVAGGEVTAIDSAGFGPISISQAVTITSPNGVEAGIVATGGSAIFIGAGSTDTVTLRGLTLDGVNVTNTGVSFIAGAKLEVIDCTIRNFTSAGVNVTSGTATSVLISNTIVTNAGSDGIVLTAGVSGATITAAIDHLTAGHDATGLSTDASSAPIELVISNSTFHDSVHGEIVLSGGGVSAVSTAFLKNVTLNEGAGGIGLNGNTAVYLSQVNQTSASGIGSTLGIVELNSNNAVFSDGTNHFQGSAPAASAWSPY